MSKSNHKNESCRADILKLLADINTNALSYHNHKELCAWGAVVAVYAVVLPLDSLIAGLISARGSSPLLIFQLRMLLTLVFAAILVFAFIYMTIQYKLRRIWGDVTLVGYRLTARVLTMTDDEVKQIELDVLSLEELDEIQVYARLAMPRLIRDEFDHVHKKLHPQRVWLERLTYILCMAGAVIGLISIWLR